MGRSFVVLAVQCQFGFRKKKYSNGRRIRVDHKDQTLIIILIRRSSMSKLRTLSPPSLASHPPLCFNSLKMPRLSFEDPPSCTPPQTRVVIRPEHSTPIEELNRLTARISPSLVSQPRRVHLGPCKETYSRSNSPQRPNENSLLQEISLKPNMAAFVTTDKTQKSFKTKSSFRRIERTPNLKIDFQRHNSLKVELVDQNDLIACSEDVSMRIVSVGDVVTGDANQEDVKRDIFSLLVENCEEVNLDPPRQPDKSQVQTYVTYLSHEVPEAQEVLQILQVLEIQEIQEIQDIQDIQEIQVTVVQEEAEKTKDSSMKNSNTFKSAEENMSNNSQVSSSPIGEYSFSDSNKSERQTEEQLLEKYLKETEDTTNRNDIPRKEMNEEIEGFWEESRQQTSTNQIGIRVVEVPVTLTSLSDDSLAIHHFVKGRRLGKGMFGEVFVTRHLKTGFLCALKILNKEFIKQQRMEEQLVKQLKIHTFLGHPNVVQIYGYFDDAENIYVMQELCTGGQLFDLVVRRRRISERRTAYYLRQLVQGLKYLNDLNIIHRDIKPENILIQEGVVKICDFGWAVYSRSGEHTQKCGTPLYMAPEVIRGDTYSRHIDTWGMGLITYELIVGNIPWNIWTEEETQKIVEDELTFPSYVPITSKAEDFIRLVLTKDPAARMTLQDSLDHSFLSEVNPLEYQNQSFQGYGQATPERCW